MQRSLKQGRLTALAELARAADRHGRGGGGAGLTTAVNDWRTGCYHFATQLLATGGDVLVPKEHPRLKISYETVRYRIGWD